MPDLVTATLVQAGIHVICLFDELPVLKHCMFYDYLYAPTAIGAVTPGSV